MAIADRINESFDQAKPWELAKDPRASAHELHGRLLATASRTSSILTVLLRRCCPALAAQAAAFLGLDAAIRLGRHRAAAADGHRSTTTRTS